MSCTKPIKASRCDQFGVCQGLGADQCPDCDSWECSVPCSDPPMPTRPLAAVAFPFAPGVIQGPHTAESYDDDCGLPLSLRELAFVAALVLSFSVLGGLIARLLS